VPAITIAGAGPAGSAAALAALSEGSQVRLFEKSPFPRHKVCGEFLSPEIQPALESLGVWSDLLKAAPAPIHSVKLHFGDREKTWRLPQPAFGLSRYRLDKLLLDCAISRGAELIREGFPSTLQPTILAYGRMAVATEKNRLFGFKAHFTGPADNAVELFVGRDAYAGVSLIEDGATNVCGLAQESLLSAHGFDIDSWIRAWPALEDRLRPLSRSMDWLITGPLVFSRNLHSLIDPFTGSGILSALMTGKLAGAAAARRTACSEYLRQCSRALRRQYRISSVVRFAIRNGLAGTVARLLPGDLLFSLTRPNMVLK